MALTETQKKRSPRPAGMAWLLPALPVQDVQKSIEFCEKAFGFEKLMAMPGPDGKIVHAEMKYEGEAIVMFGLECAEAGHGKPPAASNIECPIGLYVYCDNVDALYNRAKSAGATVLKEPEDMFWGDRVAEFRDPDGYRWMFATNVADFDPSKMPKG